MCSVELLKRASQMAKFEVNQMRGCQENRWALDRRTEISGFAGRM